MCEVVPLTGHVDRNFERWANEREVKSSCPSRGTWIEICLGKEGVGALLVSCPSRGTWIEIFRVVGA